MQEDDFMGIFRERKLKDNKQKETEKDKQQKPKRPPRPPKPPKGRAKKAEGKIDPGMPPTVEMAEKQPKHAEEESATEERKPRVVRNEK